VTTLQTGAFTGQLVVMASKTSIYRARVTAPSRMLELDSEAFRRGTAAQPDIVDVFISGRSLSPCGLRFHGLYRVARLPGVEPAFDEEGRVLRAGVTLTEALAISSLERKSSCSGCRLLTATISRQP
jgi:hypothetical protein